jgi:hypothetical protein
MQIKSLNSTVTTNLSSPNPTAEGASLKGRGRPTCGQKEGYAAAGAGVREEEDDDAVEVAEDQNFLRVPMSFALFIWGTRSGLISFLVACFCLEVQ